MLQATVVGAPDERWGETVKAIVLLRSGQTATEDGIVSFCRERIANYKVPKSVTFATAPLPKTGTGKIAKAELRAPFWAGQQRKI